MARILVHMALLLLPMVASGRRVAPEIIRVLMKQKEHTLTMYQYGHKKDDLNALSEVEEEEADEKDFIETPVSPTPGVLRMGSLITPSEFISKVLNKSSAKTRQMPKDSLVQAGIYQENHSMANYQIQGRQQQGHVQDKHKQQEMNLSNLTQAETSLGDLESSTVDVEVLLMSGEKLATVAAHQQWTGSDLTSFLNQQLSSEKMVTSLLVGGRPILDRDIVGDLGIVAGSIIYASTEQCAFKVSDSGTHKVNGHYFEGEARNGAPSYINKNDTDMIIYDYIFHSGRHFWYFSDKSRGLIDASGDYFRILKGENVELPLVGWSAPEKQCPVGILPLPNITKCTSDKAL